MGFAYKLSVATACVFTEIFTALLENPNRKRQAIN
jgi:hypothetical protein